MRPLPYTSCKHTMGLGTPGILWGCAVHVYFAVDHCKDTLGFGTASIVCGWGTERIPCGYRLGTAGIPWNILQLGTAEILCGLGTARTQWFGVGGAKQLGNIVLRRYSEFEHCCDTLATARAAILPGPLWAFHLKGAAKTL